MPSPFFRDTSFAKAAPTGGGGIGSGTKELSYAGLSAGAETGLGTANGAPLSGTEVANAAAAKASAEASALSAQAFAKTTAATVGVGHAAIGKVSIGNSMLGQPAIGNATIGQAAVGNAAVGQAAVGHAAIGHAAIGHAAVGHVAIAQAAAGNAAIAQAALAAATEPISPLVQLIMRLPGATGMAHSFFEWLANMFMPGGHDLMSTLSPHMMHMELAGHAATLHHVTGLVPSAGEHLTAGLNSLNGLHAPILESMQHSGAISGLDSGFGSFNLHGGLSEHFTQNPANVGAGPDYSHAQFEQAATGSVDSGLAGPSMSGSAGGSYLAGNQRLFSDNMSGGGQFNSITSNTSVPATSTAVPNAVTGIGQDMNQMSAQAASQTAAAAPTSAGSAPAADSQQFGPSAFGQKYGSDNVVAADSQVYRPTTGNYYQGAGGSSDVTPLKAKQLTFEDIHKGVVGDHGKKLIDDIAAGKKSPDIQMPASYKPAEMPAAPSAPQHAAAAPHPAAKQIAAAHAAKPHAVDAVAHRDSLPKSYEAATHHEAAHHQLHHTTHKHTEIAQAPSYEAAPQADNQNAGAVTDQAQTPVAPGADQAQPQAMDYEVAKGDSLWNIAKDKLGDGHRWTEIYKLNNDVIGQNPDLIFSGTHLRLPGADSLVADVGKYTVKPGDCLWNIAKNHLGNATKWSDIYKANMNVIGTNPSLIQPGQQLSLGGNIAQMPSADNMASAPPSQPAGTADLMGGQQAAMPSGFNQASMSAPQPQAMPVSENVIKVVPQHDLPDGPGAAGAATLKPASNALVSNSLAPDLSLLDQRR